MRILKRSLPLLAIDLSNLTWIGWLAYRILGSASDRPLLFDPVLIALLGVSVALHLMRWRTLDKSSARQQASASTTLHAMMDSANRLFLGRVPYLVSPLLSYSILEHRSTDLVASSPQLMLSVGDAFVQSMRTEGVRPAHATVLALATFSLYSGPSPSFLGAIGQLPIIVWILMVVILGLSVYSAAILLFTLNGRR